MKVHSFALTLLLCGGPLPTLAVPKRRRLGSKTKSPGRSKCPDIKRSKKQEKCEKDFSRSGLTLLTDAYGDETYWELEDSDDNVLLSVDYNTYEDHTLYNVDFGCLEEDDCYEFAIYDDFGDGINEGDGCGGYSIHFGKEDFPSPSMGNFGKKESIFFGDACERRVLAESELVQHKTTVEDDERTVKIELSVAITQHLHVVVLDDETEEVLEELWDGMASPETHVVLSYDTKNVHVPTYSVRVLSQDTGYSKTFALFQKKTAAQQQKE